MGDGGRRSGGGGGGDVGDDLRDDGGWFCSEGQALPVVEESLDVFAGHLTTKVSLFFLFRTHSCRFFFFADVWGKTRP